MTLYNNNNINNNINNNNNNNNNKDLYLKRVTQSNCNDLPGEALQHVYISSLRAQGYKVVRCNAFRYLDLKEGRDGAHLIALVKPFQTLGPGYEMHFWPIYLLHFYENMSFVWGH